MRISSASLLVGIGLLTSACAGPTPSTTTTPAHAAEADDFTRPFRLLYPAGSGLAVTDSSRFMFALTHGSTETYPGAGYEETSGVWGLTVTWGVPARTHETGARDTLILRPASFFDDLRRNQSVDVGDPRPVSLGGFAGLYADVRGNYGQGGQAYPDIHLGDSALVALGFPGRLMVADAGAGASLVVHIWASSEEELTAWLPVASQIAASMRFTGE